MRSGLALALLGAVLLSTSVLGDQRVAPARAADIAVAIPAQPGPVDGTTQNSDEFIWNLLIQIATPALPSQSSPVVFETWASDADTFTVTPHWPTPDEPKRLQASVLASATQPSTGPIDVPCKPPPGAATGGFPLSGTPTPCIAEEVKRNRPQFDYIVQNNLNTPAGRAVAFANGFKVTMPTTAVAIKGDWIPVQTMLQWLPPLADVRNIERQYYTATSGSVEYALVAVHVSSRQNMNWVWGTFEHEFNPGRCDSIGCFDSYGAQVATVLPNRDEVNTQYGPCSKTQALANLMATAKLSPVWEHYCLKGTEVDFTAADGTPYALGNSVIEGITGNGTISASSCIACHAYASFGSDGTPTASAQAILPYNPTGRPIQGVLDDSRQFDFMWGVILQQAQE